jgi:hypothetical protein
MANPVVDLERTRHMDHRPQLGIPHFQRGLAWGTEARSALLKSLFFDTPCGSFVLRQPADCTGRSVPLDARIGRGSGGADSYPTCMFTILLPIRPTARSPNIEVCLETRA